MTVELGGVGGVVRMLDGEQEVMRVQQLLENLVWNVYL
jgi:hypothetical protein